MPWSTPTLRKVREMVRDDVTANLYGASFIGNNVLRVMSDTMAGLTHHVLRYVDWLALQLLPDTAETEWLDRHGQIWLVNADGTVGRKQATYAAGTVTMTGVGGAVVPAGTRLLGNDIGYETIEDIVIGSNAETNVAVRALDPGAAGNEPEVLSFTVQIPSVDGRADVVELSGGTDTENDDDLRMRVLMRIRMPPMGGDATDYVQWALAVPGVTRAWTGLLDGLRPEMGMGTVTVRFMCDDLRADRGGFPSNSDIQRVIAYLDTVRPVAVKDFFVVSPIPQRVDVHVQNLSPDTTQQRAEIEASLADMLFRKAKPGQTIFAAWKYQAIMDAPGVDSFARYWWKTSRSSAHSASLANTERVRTRP